MKLRLLAIAALAAAGLLAGCSKNQPQAQNVQANNLVTPPPDIETLPPDESAGSATNQLDNAVGNDQLTGNDLNDVD